MMASAELEEKQEKFEQEKDQFKEEMKGLNRKMNTEQERIRKDSRLVDEKLEIIKDGFRKLDMDRRRLDKEWARLAAEKELIEEHGLYDVYTETSVFFRGVKNILTLKKRYKDLTKIFHPEELAFSPIAIGILAVSILVKCYMFLYNRSLGKKLDSAAMTAYLAAVRQNLG